MAVNKVQTICPWACLLLVLLALNVNAATAQTADSERQLQIDIFGSGQFSRFNFTNLTTPYDGVDAYTVVRVAHWWDQGRRIGLFGELNPVFSSPDEFSFQRYLQLSGGIQLYPAGGILKPLRVFAKASRRSHYGAGVGPDVPNADFETGVDHYYDNLFAPSRWKAISYTTAGFHSTQFSIDRYNAVLWTGSFRAGPSFRPDSDSMFVPYGLVDWAYAGADRDRFWENYLRTGAGMRWYPQMHQGGSFGTSLAGRFHIFAEAVGNLAWLGNAPAGSVPRYDVRLGLGFSTGGIYRYGSR